MPVPLPAFLFPVSAGFTRRIRTGMLMLAAFALIAAGLAPLCGALCCPAAPAAISMHAAMPCCAGEASMARSEDMREQQSTTATARVDVSPPAVGVVSVIARQANAPSGRHEVTRSAAQQQPSPPLFLLNAQFLI
jgi:hypothetical protein